MISGVPCSPEACTKSETALSAKVIPSGPSGQSDFLWSLRYLSVSEHTHQQFLETHQQSIPRSLQLEKVLLSPYEPFIAYALIL